MIGEYWLVRGHFCEELKQHQDNAMKGYPCVSHIDSAGAFIACDGINPVYIKFCPFCGEKLSNEMKYDGKVDESEYAIYVYLEESS